MGSFLSHVASIFEEFTCLTQRVEAKIPDPEKYQMSSFEVKTTLNDLNQKTLHEPTEFERWTRTTIRTGRWLLLFLYFNDPHNKKFKPLVKLFRDYLVWFEAQPEPVQLGSAFIALQEIRWVVDAVD